MERIVFDDIYFLENNHHLIHIYTAKDSFTIRSTFAEMLSILLSDHFILCHRGYIVNLKHVQNYRTNCFIMADDAHTTIKISQSKFSEVRERFFQFLNTEPD